jgi:hypothetical protein
MRQIVTFVVLLAFLYCQCGPRQYAAYRKVGDSVIISEQVGDVIDVEERNDYDLFQGIDGFQRAKFYAMQGGGLVAEIETSEHKLVAENHDSLIPGILKEYIENHEWVQSRRDLFERKWKIVDYDVMGFPITNHEVAAISDQGVPAGCGLGTAACIFGTFSIAAIATGLSTIGDVDPPPSEETERKMRTIFYIGIGAAIGIGGLVGVYANVNSRKRALEIVKESRIPRIAE